MNFIDIFLTIDTDGNNVINKQDLVAYCQKNDLDNLMVEKWMALFDVDQDESISVDEYCNVLGLNLQELNETRQSRVVMQESGLLYSSVENLKTSSSVYQIVKEMWPRLRQAELVKAFVAMDRNNDRQISLKEFSLYANEKNLPPEMTENLTSLYDGNKDGVISLEDYCKLMNIPESEVHEARRQEESNLVNFSETTRVGNISTDPVDFSLQTSDLTSDQKMAFIQAFITIDKNQNNRLSRQELSNYAAERNLPQEWVQQLTSACDENADTEITLDEYCMVLWIDPKEIIEARARMAAPFRSVYDVVNDTWPKMRQMELIRAFRIIDRNNDEQISLKELSVYAKEKNLPPEMTKEYMSLYDKDKDGVITFEEYCKVLGIDRDEIHVAREMSLNTTPQVNLHSNPEKVLLTQIDIINSSMQTELQLEIIKHVLELMPENDNTVEPKSVSQGLKSWLDKKYDRIWQVLIINGSYWMNYSHEPDKALNFKYKNFIFLIWRTPAG